MTKQLIVLCDGTGQSPQADVAGVPDNIQFMRQKLAENLPGKANIDYDYSQGWEIDFSQYNDTDRYVYYDSGLGAPKLNNKGHVISWKKPTSFFKNANVIYQNFLSAESEIFASGIIDNVAQAYRFLVQYYTPGDQIYLFGFSRGAYTLRLLLSVINYVGLVDRSKYPDANKLQAAIEQAFKLYDSEVSPNQNQPAQEFLTNNSVPLDKLITFYGAWECVPGYIAEKAFETVDLSPIVQTARHALAIDESRPPFAPQLWVPAPSTDSLQSWFPGSHPDLGGGDLDHYLANVPFQWIVGEAIKSGLNFAPNTLNSADLQPNPLGTQHNSGADDIDSSAPITWNDIFPPKLRNISLSGDVLLSPATLERYGKLVATINGKTTSTGPYNPANLPASLIAYNNQLTTGRAATLAALSDSGVVEDTATADTVAETEAVENKSFSATYG
jgi:hypothetical protein